MKKDKHLSIKLRAISIKNYKGIDSFSMSFPTPMLPEDPDILVMGSENGLGKTSVIECCALLLMSLSIRKSEFELEDEHFSVDIPDLLIRAGTNVAELAGDIVIGGKKFRIEMQITRDGMVKIIHGDISYLELFNYAFIDGDSDVLARIKVICGFSPSPLIESSFLLFHSYRKVQEENLELGMIVHDLQAIERMLSYRRMVDPYWHTERSLSIFKRHILQALMDRAKLFEFSEGEDSEETIDTLNELLKVYAGGTLSKLRPSAGNTVNFRITPVGGGESLAFDGLSSGQKEIISTLFLIWYHTKDAPSVVFIDEPELHLNAQWHRSFIRKLTNIAPQNQYIIATHSEDIMDSVDKEHRILLLNEKENGNA